MKATLVRLEVSVAEIKALLSATLPHLATKKELADLRITTAANFAELRQATTADIAGLRMATTSEFAALRLDLTDKPNKTYMWGILAVLLTAYACGLAALAILK